MGWKERAKSALGKGQAFLTVELDAIQRESAHSHVALLSLFDSYAPGICANASLDFSPNSLAIVEAAMRFVAAKNGNDHEWTGQIIRQSFLYLGQVICKVCNAGWGYAPTANSPVPSIVVKNKSGTVSANPFVICAQVAKLPYTHNEQFDTLSSFVSSTKDVFE